MSSKGSDSTFKFIFKIRILTIFVQLHNITYNYSDDEADVSDSPDIKSLDLQN